jgi:Fic family protein
VETWEEIEKQIDLFKQTFKDVIDFDKFNRIAVTFHSTAIEGSTLTLAESELLLDKGLTPKGRPLEHQHMVLDHHEAQAYALQMAETRAPITIPLIQGIAGLVMKHTGAKHTTPLGEYDVSKGDLRLHNVRAGEQYFVNYDKVKPLLEKLVSELQRQMSAVQTTPDKLRLSFSAHFDLVTIHPFGDGNGRTSRLLMNFIQHCHNLPISPVFQEDRGQYIEALMMSRKEKALGPFYSFMASQYLKYLKAELEKYEQQTKNTGGKGYTMVF